MNAVFRISNLLVLPFWALMIFFPRWRGTARILRSPFVSVAPALVYLALVVPRLAQIWPAVTRPVMADIAALLATPAGATIAWAHFLAFDLFVGRWIYLDSQDRHISLWLTSPLLFLTLMLGPIGFVLYLVTRSFSAVGKPAAADSESADLSNQTGVASLAARPNLIETARAWLRRASNISRPLTILGIAMFLLLLGTLVELIVDHRVITGAPAWLKPAKFSISTSIYSFTFVWLLGFVENHPRLVRLVANVTVLSIVVEMIAIVVQAARGTTSHFNMTTPFDTLLWAAMGTFIILLWLMNLMVTVLLLRQRMPDRAFAWSLRFGLIISLVGMAVAFFMVTPTHQQIAMVAAGGPRILGAHSVGVPDGGPGLPILGWSTQGGDLRIAHFVGLHGMQILPFLGWLIIRRRGIFARFGEGHRVALVWTAGLSYLGLVVLLTWQALRGQPLVHPDVATMAAAGALVVGTAVSILAIVAVARRAASERLAVILRSLVATGPHSSRI